MNVIYDIDFFFRKENACHLHNAFFLLAYEYLKCVHNGVYVFSIIRNKYPVSIQSKIIKIDSIGKYRFFFPCNSWYLLCSGAGGVGERRHLLP